MSGAASLRWIPPLHLAGAWQMAIDTWLLDRAVRLSASEPGGGAVLRFYSWSRPTLSLGFHQRPLEPRWLALQRAGELALVRRPSGGRAVLHACELTYCLIWPQAPFRRQEAYQRTCAWLQAGFSSLGMPLRFGTEPAGLQQASCFASRTAADLVEPGGGKRIGSAQLWRRGVLLQHGSILIAPPRDLWQRCLGEEAPALAPLPCQGEQLIRLLQEAAQAHLPLAASSWRQQPLTGEEWSAIAARRQQHQLP
jgi:lipoate---protein ligase